MAASMFTFIVFVSSALLVAVQLASAQLTPRIIGIVFRDPVTKGIPDRVRRSRSPSRSGPRRESSFVPILTAYIAAYGSLVSLGVFLYLIDHVGKPFGRAGPSADVARVGRGSSSSVYPAAAGRRPGPPARSRTFPRTRNRRPCLPNPADGVVLAFDVRGWWPWPSAADCVIELVPQVGDFVAAGDPLFRVYGDGRRRPARPRPVQSVALGQERTPRARPGGSSSASSSISPPRAFRRRSTTRPPPSSPSTRSITCCGTSATAAWTTSGSATPPAGSGSSTAPRTGRISSSWRSPKSASSAAGASRSPGGCGPCWRT